jgi:hypothetical protein
VAGCWRARGSERERRGEDVHLRLSQYLDQLGVAILEESRDPLRGMLSAGQVGLAKMVRKVAGTTA